MTREFVIGRKRGLRIFASSPGPWLSLGVHAHGWPPSEAHLDLHLLWVWVGIGRHWGGDQS